MNRREVLARMLALGATAVAVKDLRAGEEKIAMKKLTPILTVEEIEPCLPFWVDRLGFQKTSEVPEGPKLGFVILEKDNVEIMYQTLASVRKDAPAVLKGLTEPHSFLYIEVEKLDPIVAKLQGADVVVPVRTTFYGAREIGVREPGGSIVIFAEFTQKSN